MAERTLLLACLAATVLVSAPVAGEISSARRAELLHLLVHDCGSCHGMRLTGGLGPPLTAAALRPKPNDALEHVIAQGRAGTAMPPWRAILSAEETRWLVEQLKTGEARLR